MHVGRDKWSKCIPGLSPYICTRNSESNRIVGFVVDLSVSHKGTQAAGFHIYPKDLQKRNVLTWLYWNNSEKKYKALVIVLYFEKNMT